ncbi:MAG: GPO family capsid scaffolding protein [Moraxellaceae bacterium]|nr:GPO family capsid scaffolding protein [Moraxellaceae bacterium]
MPKKFRVAVEGQATDGRTISRQDIQDMAATYNPQTYGARIWMEHYRSALADSPFKAYGDVIACYAEEITDGALAGKLGLYADIEPTPDLIAMAKAKQKVYFSIELFPNFVNSGKAYLYGLGVTDSPASLGTEYLQFNAALADKSKSPLAARKIDKNTLFSSAEFEASFDEAPSNEPSLFNKVMGWLKPKEAKTQANFSEIENSFKEVTNFCTDLKTTVDNLGKQLTKVETELATEKQNFATFKTQIDGQPPANYSQRPNATGGNGIQETDC